MKTNLPSFLVLAVLAGGVAVFMSGGPSGSSGPQVNVTLPQLSTAAVQGRGLFEDNCAACHGANASGSENGPPLIHKIYEPNHHGDQSFYMAVQRGVRSHHWNFGNMQPVPDVGRQEVSRIIRYVRELQRANGIS